MVSAGASPSPAFVILTMWRAEDPLSPEAQRMFLLIATSGILHLDDQWGGSTHKEVDYNPFLQDAEWYANQEREDDE